MAFFPETAYQRSPSFMERFNAQELKKRQAEFERERTFAAQMENQMNQAKLPYANSMAQSANQFELMKALQKQHQADLARQYAMNEPERFGLESSHKRAQIGKEHALTGKYGAETGLAREKTSNEGLRGIGLQNQNRYEQSGLQVAKFLRNLPEEVKTVAGQMVLAGRPFNEIMEAITPGMQGAPMQGMPPQGNMLNAPQGMNNMPQQGMTQGNMPPQGMGPKMFPQQRPMGMPQGQPMPQGNTQNQPYPEQQMQNPEEQEMAQQRAQQNAKYIHQGQTALRSKQIRGQALSKGHLTRGINIQAIKNTIGELDPSVFEYYAGLEGALKYQVHLAESLIPGVKANPNFVKWESFLKNKSETMTKEARLVYGSSIQPSEQEKIKQTFTPSIFTSPEVAINNMVDFLKTMENTSKTIAESIENPDAAIQSLKPGGYGKFDKLMAMKDIPTEEIKTTLLEFPGINDKQAKEIIYEAAITMKEYPNLTPDAAKRAVYLQMQKNKGKKK